MFLCIKTLVCEAVHWNGFRVYQLEPHKAVAEVSKIGNL